MLYPFNYSNTLKLDGNNGNYILSISDDEFKNIYLSIHWISLAKTNIGELYRDVSRSTGLEIILLDKESNEVNIDCTKTGELFTGILSTICNDLGIGKFTGDNGNITSITLTRTELESITSNYRINLVKSDTDKINFTVSEILERKLK